MANDLKKAKTKNPAFGWDFFKNLTNSFSNLNWSFLLGTKSFNQETIIHNARSQPPLVEYPDQLRSLKSSEKNNFSFLSAFRLEKGAKGKMKPDAPKQQVVSITYEEIGLFPRSFNRVFDRFFKQLFFDVENLVIQEYRFYRYLFLTTVKCLFILIFVPFVVNFMAKNYLVRPITEYYWNIRQPEIFLNSYQQKRAFTELQDFEEKLYFESLTFPSLYSPFYSPRKIINESSINMEKGPTIHIVKTENEKNLKPLAVLFPSSPAFVVSSEIKISDSQQKNAKTFEKLVKRENVKQQQSIQQRLQNKTLELAMHYNEESIEAITNFFADLMSFSTLFFLLFNLEIQINITKSFLLEVFFGLDDSKKSLFILFFTDLLVGYHSPNIWELFFQSLFDHYGLPESQTTIFLLVATLPVLLDVLFKYLIFRHLNRASPATVATYHAMIE
uniref:Potassium/proton antiporter CemA n=1 Tax=Pseudomuriella schumacherensis TaxID=889459 RepID=A0A140HB52_PSESB|nr:chloroplast envelope membrane protein [Pseudomuriella schumacherensis]AMO01401.1 chloroplast envelope membrane protein [Pseudomuriella schumacherensis]